MPEPIEVVRMRENYNNREYVLKAVSEQGSLLFLDYLLYIWLIQIANYYLQKMSI